MEDKFYEVIVEKEELNWKDLLFSLMKEEGMSPWNIDVARLTKRYLDSVKEFRKKDFAISGNVILAAALLVKMKSQRLVGEDLDALDRIIASSEDDTDEFYDELEKEYLSREYVLTDIEKMRLIPRTPQPRERKVSIYDLVGALEKALEVKKRKVIRTMPVLKIDIPEKKIDIVLLVRQVYKKILDMLLRRKKKSVKFSELASKSKEEILSHFVPILHLANDRKITLEQSRPFGDIEIEVIEERRFKA